jgi:uncharacterized protein YecT (DUF1311 family)
MMIRSLLVATLVALALSESAVAAPRGGKIEACVNAAQTMDAMRKCKRIVFEPCYKEPDHMQSTHGLVMCNSREGDEWQALLESRTVALKKRDTYRAEALTAADAAWRAWIEVECNWHRAEAMGGSAEGVITTECISDLTADRVILLTWQLRGNVIY